MNTTPSDTPRVDEWATDIVAWKGQSVCADFARQLERENQEYLDAAKTAADEKCTANEHHCTCVPLLRVSLLRCETQLASAQVEIDRLREWIQSSGEVQRWDSLYSENQKLRKTLTFYANMNVDGGYRAMEALSTEPKGDAPTSVD